MLLYLFLALSSWLRCPTHTEDKGSQCMSTAKIKIWWGKFWIYNLHRIKSSVTWRAWKPVSQTQKMIHHIQIGAHLFIEGKRTNNHKKDWHAHWNLDQESNLDQHTKTLYKLGENAKGGDNVKHTIPVHQHRPPDGDSKSFHCLKSFCSCLGYTLKQTTYVSRGEGARGYQSPIISCPSTSLLLADWLEVVRAVLLLPRQCNSCSWRLWISSLSCWMFFSCTNITCK